jgi:hypothetical protein
MLFPLLSDAFISCEKAAEWHPQAEASRVSEVMRECISAGSRERRAKSRPTHLRLHPTPAVRPPAFRSHSGNNLTRLYSRQNISARHEPQCTCHIGGQPALQSQCVRTCNRRSCWVIGDTGIWLYSPRTGTGAPGRAGGRKHSDSTCHFALPLAPVAENNVPSLSMR